MKWKKIFRTLLFPPIWVLLLLSVLSTAALVTVFVKGLDESPVAYAVYVLAFYTLSIVCIFFSAVLPKRYNEIKRKIYTIPILNRYMTDAAFHTHVSLYCSLFVNLLYVGVNAFSFIDSRSMWFVVLAVYYFILAVMRFLLARYSSKAGIGNNRLGELSRTILCSSIMLTLNFVLSGAVLMILYQDRGFEYRGILIYVMAAYTFYITVHAITSLVKYRKYNSPVMMTTKMISLSAALVSMLSLETAMFASFGQEMTIENKRLMIALTGAGVSIVVITMSLYMIIKSAKEIKLLGESKNGKQRNV